MRNHGAWRQAADILVTTLLLSAAVLCGHAAAAPRTCDLQLTVHLTPDVPNPSDLSFLSALVGNPQYALTWIEQSENGDVLLELTGPGPRVNCQRVVDAMRRNAHVESITVQSLRQKQ